MKTYLTMKHQVKQLSKKEYKTVKYLCHIAKNLANQAIYNVRQYYFQEGEYLNYEKNYTLLKNSENYKLLNSNMAQQILKEVDGMFKSFFGLIKLAKKGKYNFRDIRLPSYLPKDGVMTLIIGFVRINSDNSLTIPFSQSFKKENRPITIKLPPKLQDEKIKEIRIIPKNNARFFELQYIYEVEVIQRDLDTTKALAIDLGVDNLATCVTNKGESFILDGRKIKSLNQWYNKENAKLQSIKDKQGNLKRYTNRQLANLTKRNNRVNDCMNKIAKYIVNYCIKNNIGKIVCGYNETFQYKPKMSKKTKQHFLGIPYGKLREKLEYLCELNDIIFIKQEESYTSKSSFFDNDPLPVYNADNPQSYKFSGRRVKRGLYKTGSNEYFNADCNGALNILRKYNDNCKDKSKTVSMSTLCSSGDLNTPVRIRLI